MRLDEAEASVCCNRWFSGKLSMGVEAAVSRYVKQGNDGERSEAGKLLKQLNARIQNCPLFPHGLGNLGE